VVSDVTTNDPSPITVPDCCTPETLFLEDPEGVVLDSADSGFSSGDCVNDELDEGDFDVEFCCDKVTVSVNEDLECPVTATLNLQSELEDACSETTITKDLSPENRTVVFTVDECGCVPTSVVINGFMFDPEEPLNCICENFEELCKKEAEDLFYDSEGNLLTTPYTVECNGVDITITDVETKDDDEVVCFDFESSEPIFKLFVKGGGGPDAGETYEYPCGTTDASDLCANVQPRSGQQTAVSNVTFYVCADELDYCNR